MILLALASGASVSCRHYSPVERHFLRVPAHAAADLSSIDRVKWMKPCRKLGGFRETAKTLQTMVLPLEVQPPAVKAPEGEVKFFASTASGAAGKDGAVALNWAEAGGRLDPRGGSGTRLHLLRTQGGRYIVESLDRLLPKGLEVERHAFAQEPGLVFCYRRMGAALPVKWRKVAVLKWDGRAWSGKALEEPQS